MSLLGKEQETNYWKPPLLYKKPDDESVKWMIKKYLEKKKLL